MVADAKALELAGAFASCLELVPALVAQEISHRICIPTIGIGSGRSAMGEIQVFHASLDSTPTSCRHTRRYLNVAQDISTAARQYVDDVIAGNFPGLNRPVTWGAGQGEFRSLLESSRS